MTRCPTIEAVYQEGYDAGFRAAKEQGSRSAEAKKDRALRQSFRDVLFEIDNACTNATEPRDGRYEAVREVVLRELFPGEALPAEPSKVMAAFERSMKDNAELLERLVASDTTDPEVIAMNERDPVTSEAKQPTCPDCDEFSPLVDAGGGLWKCPGCPLRVMLPPSESATHSPAEPPPGFVREDQFLTTEQWLYEAECERDRLRTVLGLIAEQAHRCEDCDESDARLATHVTFSPWSSVVPIYLCDEHAEDARRANTKAESKGSRPQPSIDTFSQDTAVQLALGALSGPCAGGGQEGEKPCK